MTAIVSPHYALVARVLEIADREVGVREVGRNDGPRVKQYLASVGLDPGLAWCAAFVHWCFQQAAADLGVKNPCPKTGSVRKMWERAPAHFKVETNGKPNPCPQPGAIFIKLNENGTGHTGIVTCATPTHLLTVEGNTNDAGHREGDGVYRRTRRYDEIVGVIDFGREWEGAQS